MRRPVLVMVKPRQPREARSSTAQTRRHAAGLAGESADDLDAAAGLAEGALDEVGVAHALVVLDREAQVGGQALPVGQQALDRRRIAAAPDLGKGVDAPLHPLDEVLAGLDVLAQLAEVEDLPVGGLHLGLVAGADLGQHVAGAMDQTPLAQRAREGLLGGADQAGCAVGDDQQRWFEAAAYQVGQEVVPGVGGLGAGGGQARRRRACRRW